MNDYWIYYFLLIVGGYFFILQIKLMLFPQMKGVIVGFEDYASCSSCKGNNKGRMSVPVKVKIENDGIIDAELSCCTICLNKINIGSRIGVTKIGTRNIGLPLMNLRGT